MLCRCCFEGCEGWAGRPAHAVPAPRGVRALSPTPAAMGKKKPKAEEIPPPPAIPERWARQRFPPEHAAGEPAAEAADWQEATRVRLRGEYAAGRSARAPPALERWAEARAEQEDLRQEIREHGPDADMETDDTGVDPRRVAEFKRLRFNAACQPIAIDPEKKTLYVCGRPVQA